MGGSNDLVITSAFLLSIKVGFYDMNETFDLMLHRLRHYFAVTSQRNKTE